MLNLDGVGLFALGDLGQSGGGAYRIEEESWPARRTFQVDPRRPAVPGKSIRVWRGKQLTGVALLGDLRRMQALKAELLEQRRGEE